MFFFYSRASSGVELGGRLGRHPRRGSFTVSLMVVLLLLSGFGSEIGGVGGDAQHHHRGVPDRMPEHPAVGEKAPEFTLRDLQGQRVALGEFLGRGYLVLLFGSSTSTQFREQVLKLSELLDTWSRWEVQVLIVYTRETHPARLRDKAPETYGERVALARETLEELDITIPLVVDEWDDPVHLAYGGMPHAAFLLDSQGLIQARQVRANAHQLDKEIRRLLDVSEP